MQAYPMTKLAFRAGLAKSMVEDLLLTKFTFGSQSGFQKSKAR
jgi:hypothetical protein